MAGCDFVYWSAYDWEASEQCNWPLFCQHSEGSGWFPFQCICQYSLHVVSGVFIAGIWSDIIIYSGGLFYSSSTCSIFRPILSQIYQKLSNVPFILVIVHLLQLWNQLWKPHANLQWPRQNWRWYDIESISIGNHYIIILTPSTITNPLLLSWFIVHRKRSHHIVALLLTGCLWNYSMNMLFTSSFRCWGDYCMHSEWRFHPTRFLWVIGCQWRGNTSSSNMHLNSVKHPAIQTISTRQSLGCHCTIGISTSCNLDLSPESDRNATWVVAVLVSSPNQLFLRIMI